MHANDRPQEADARLLLNIARGFLCFFWSVPLYLLTLLRGSQLKLVIFERLAVPLLVVPGILALSGSLLLRRTRRLSVEWAHGTDNLLRAVLAAMYFSLPAGWWLALQRSDYLFLNFLLLILCLLWMLQAVGFLGGELGRILGRRTLAVEAEVGEWGVIILQLLPYLAMFTIAIYHAFQSHLPLPIGMQKEVLRLPVWLRAAALLPCAVIMSVCWRCRSLCIEGIIRNRRLPVGGSG
ncbi:MAG TPA: hypothetical protein ENG36_01670 [Lentisphaerae bacterium]|nr:MAG: hypothetical protein DRP22_00260 [Verrucomicrobiota bacterium]HDL77461.1 hypothetical protein [Lentisphaerota bacterium]